MEVEGDALESSMKTGMQRVMKPKNCYDKNTDAYVRKVKLGRGSGEQRYGERNKWLGKFGGPHRMTVDRLPTSR